MISRDEVIQVAKECFDPEIPVNIWDLGLIYDMEFVGETSHLKIIMTLTSEHCPAAKSIPEDFKTKLLATQKVKNVQIDIVYQPIWTPERITQDGKKKLGIEL